MKKKVNPRKRPANQLDVIKAKREAQEKAIAYAWAIFFTVMRDKEGWGKARLSRLWEEVNDLSDSVAQGYVSIHDLLSTLKDDGFVLKGGAE